ncbi:hypothetical protein TNCV_2581931 [Trichonephila clavipes]|nr:hypothetical protein TNCV_2581931 [Trichonephila clavipes]
MVNSFCIPYPHDSHTLSKAHNSLEHLKQTHSLFLAVHLSPKYSLELAEVSLKIKMTRGGSAWEREAHVQVKTYDNPQPPCDGPSLLFSLLFPIPSQLEDEIVGIE